VVAAKLLALNPRRADSYSSELVSRYVIPAVTSFRVPAARAYSLGSDRPDGPRFGHAPRIGVLRDRPVLACGAGEAKDSLGMSCHPTGQGIVGEKSKAS
jgi:hypothetical protein